MVTCPYCLDIDPAVAAGLGAVCPKCLQPFRPRRRQAPSFSRSTAFDAHDTEASYGQTGVARSRKPLQHDAHDVLAYAKGLLEVTGTGLDYILSSPTDSALLGFMTGSSALDWVLRRRAGHLLENRMRHSRGLSHCRGGRKPARELSAVLRAWTALGVRRIVIVDEVVGGTQLHTAVLKIVRWYRSGTKARPRLDLMLVGVGESSRVGNDVDAWLERMILHGDARVSCLPRGLSVSCRLVTVPRLLAMDKPGMPIKGTAQRRDGSYVASRQWPGGYSIRCPNHLDAGGGAELSVINSAGSLDQVFGVAIYAICGFGYVSAERWPETIRKYGCTECNQLLSNARALGKAIAERVDTPERTSGCLFTHPNRRAESLVTGDGASLHHHSAR